jgi:hypothetical protein
MQRGATQNVAVFTRTNDLFRKAITLDPGYLAPYAALRHGARPCLLQSLDRTRTLAEADKLADEAIERDRLRHSSTAWLRWSRCTGKTSNAGPPKSTKRCRSIRTLRRPCRSEWRCISIRGPPSGDPRPRTGHAARSAFHLGLSAPSRCGPYHRRRIRNGCRDPPGAYPLTRSHALR